MSQHTQSHISGTSRRAQEISGLLAGSFDLLVLFSSWDARCVCISEAFDVTAERSVFVDFAHRGELGQRDRHDAILRGYADRVSKHSDVVKGASEDLNGIWGHLADHLVAAYRRTGRPLRLLVDLSASPRFYSLGLLAYGIGKGLVRELTFLYAEASYQDPVSGGTSEVFTTGRWETVPIPLLLGECDPEKDRHYFVSVGFEGSKTLRVVTRAEPDHVSVLFPDPGYEIGYVATTARNNSDLIAQFSVPDSRIVKAPAGDSIAAWEAIGKTDLDEFGKYNVYYICCGTKPHSLALALRAMALGYPTVLYNKPDRHRESIITPSGKYWRFDIVDLSAAF